MTLIPGAFLSYTSAVPSGLPTAIPFQYNPSEVTRVITPAPKEEPKTPPTPGAAAATSFVPSEEISLKVEFDAADGLEVSGPITSVAGIGPQIAAVESLMYPSPAAGLFGLLPQVLQGGGSAIPPTTLPFIIFVWGPGRITPVRMKSLSIHETEFDTVLNPIHASADIGLTVLRAADFTPTDALGQTLSAAYDAMRQAKATLALPQAIELAAPRMTGA